MKNSRSFRLYIILKWILSIFSLSTESIWPTSVRLVPKWHSSDIIVKDSSDNFLRNSWLYLISLLTFSEWVNFSSFFLFLFKDSNRSIYIRLASTSFSISIDLCPCWSSFIILDPALVRESDDEFVVIFWTLGKRSMGFIMSLGDKWYLLLDGFSILLDFKKSKCLWRLVGISNGFLSYMFIYGGSM